MNIRCNRAMPFIVLILLIFMGARTGFADGFIRFDTQDFPPFCHVDESGDSTGMLVDLAKMIAEKAGISYRVRGYPAKRLYRNLALGDSDMTIGIKEVPEYEGKVIFSRMPLTHIDLRLYGMPGSSLPQDNAGLKGKRLIVIRGYGYGGFINYLQDPANGILVDPSNSHESAFKKLFAKRGDYVLDYRRPASDTIKALGYHDLETRSVFKIELFMITSKKASDAEKLMARMEEAFDQLKKEGALAHLLSDEMPQDKLLSE